MKARDSVFEQDRTDMPRIRVLRIIARMNVGGPALQVTGLIDGLDRTRYESLLLVGNVAADELDYTCLRAPHVSSTTVPGLGRELSVWGDAWALQNLVREIRRFRPHIVHTHTAKAGFLGRVAARLCRVPAIVHSFHGHLLQGYFSRPATKAVITTERAFARFTTRIVAVGSQVRDDLLSAGIGRREQYVVIPPGVDLRPAPERSKARRCLGLPDNGPIVSYVARLTAVKRPDRFVDVAMRLADRCPDATFVVAGDGRLLEEMQSRALPLGSRIRFLGFRGDVEAVYAASDVVMLTSDNEGMPVSLIEAALTGRPAIATNVGSTSEVVRDGITGFVTPNDVGELTRAAERLLTDFALRQRMGTAAAEIAKSRFGGARLVRDMEHLYEIIAGENGFP